MGDAVNQLHRDVAKVALAAIRDHYGAGGSRRYALGGGNALQAHGVTTRPTSDVDLILGFEDGFSKVADLIGEALTGAGYVVEPLADGFTWPGDDDSDAQAGLREWLVTAPGGNQVQVQAAFFELLAEPVIRDGLRVVALDDAAGWKTHALVNRLALRDICDVAALLTLYTADQLIRLARERDPGLDDIGYFAEAGDHLDDVPDERLQPFLREGWTPAMVRQQFTGWPRGANEESG